jgi:hypothetical protein
MFESGSGAAPAADRPYVMSRSDIDILGVYPVDAPEPCHLVELSIRNFVGPLGLSQFTQEQPDQPRTNWQVPWDERVLDAEGASDLHGRFPRKIEATGKPLRLAFFFHHLDLSRPLNTPAGDIPLPRPQVRPQRLAFIEYESPY